MKTYSLSISLLSALFCLALLTSCGENGRGLKFGTKEIHYNSTVTRTTAAKLGQYLEKTGHFSHSEYLDLHIAKDRLDYQLHWVVGVSFLPTPDTMAYFRDLLDSLSVNVLDGRTATLYLTDHAEEEEWEVLPEAEPLVPFGQHTVYYTPSVDRADAEKLATYLSTHALFDFQTPQVLKLQAWGSEYVIYMALTDGVTKELMEQMSTLLAELRQEVFPTKELNMEFRDHLLHDLLRNVSGPFFKNVMEKDGLKIHYADDINITTVLKLQGHLRNRKTLKYAAWINLSKSEDGFKLTIPVQESVKAPIDISTARRLTMELQSALGSQVDVELYDQNTRQREFIPGGRQYELD